METKNLGEANISLLLEYSYSHLVSLQIDIDEATEELLRLTLRAFLVGEKTFEEAQAIFLEKAGTDIPLTVASEIMNVPDTPLDPPEEDEDSGDETHTRKKTRTWTTQEDQRLVAGIYRYGFDSWIRVANFVGSGRTRAQCAQRWTRGLNPKICKRGWTQEEDNQLLNYVQIYGNKSWARIANLLGNRSDVQCRYHYLQLTEMRPQATNFIPLNRQQGFLSSSGFLPSGLLQPTYQPAPMTMSQMRLPPGLVMSQPVPQHVIPAQAQPQPVMIPPAIPRNPQRIQRFSPAPQSNLVPPENPAPPQDAVHCWDFSRNQPVGLESFLNQMSANKPHF